MIEKIVLDWLIEKLGLPCYMEVPPDPPEEYITLEKTGSARENHLNRATFAVQSRAGTMYRAAFLNEQVKAAMDELPRLDAVSSSKLSSDYDFTDTSTKTYRYQAVYVVTY